LMFNNNHPSNLYVSSCLMLVKSIPFWTVDLEATDHWHDQKIDVFSQVQECRSNK
jgi:hypothetical protein